ncbi:hydantoinase B/oxoprolinase family protein [Microbacterium sp. No. 7]|uniref:hydantoinase B/oxoprolinase family protein n=1 Tax=Microbacterium sp. No. 7 TaxID=1714373 RepID=UPI0006D1E488|nr:hydantoinase B/oxoprolinase family protein [Microbacterium sp. No. 7]ALJ19283.1 methylhydantoinase [Microbacterium sp. No. 7]
MTDDRPIPADLAPESVRALSEQEFHQTYRADRFTSVVVLNRLRYAVEHMATAFMRQAFSPIIRDWYDFVCTISGGPELDYPMVATSNGLTPFLGTMADAPRNAIIEYGVDRLQPGDVLITNDPYRGGRHVNDVLFTRPVFHDGRIVAFVNLVAHQADMGGTVPGGFTATKQNVYENGLVIPPMLLWERDQPVHAVFSLIFDNTRWGGMLLPDFMATFEQLKLGERLIHEDIERYGIDAVVGTMRYSVDVSAERMREAIRSIPDGDYPGSSLFDADGLDGGREYRLHVNIRKRGDHIEADLSGTSEQARGSINAGALDAKTAVGVALTMLLDPHTPFTSGTWRNIDVAVPRRTIVSAEPPDGPTMMYWESSGALIGAVFDALNPVLGEKAAGGDYGSVNLHNAFGVNGEGQFWSSATQCGGEHGPWGATRVGDGDSYTVMYNLNNIDPATETIENDSPVVLLRKEHAIDMGGPGTFRGGAAHLRDSLWLYDANQILNPFRYKEPSGVAAHGGRPGPNGGMWFFPPQEKVQRDSLVGFSDEEYASSEVIAGVVDTATKLLDPDGEYHHFASKPVWPTRAGTVLRVITNGGGGWGDPFARDPQHVLADVRDEYVSIEGAARDYGVVVVGDPHFDPEGLRVDEEATAALRAGR